MLIDRVREHLIEVARTGQPITYQALAQKLDLRPPNTILQLTTALEQVMKADAEAEEPLIAALVVSKATGLPRLGFFECAERIGYFEGDITGPDAAIFHRKECAKAVVFWGK